MAHSSESSSGLNGIIDFVAGSLGGCANVLVGQPLDTAKVLALFNLAINLTVFNNLIRMDLSCLNRPIATNVRLTSVCPLPFAR